ncbi:WD40 repeat-like protein [Dacryopinax primogenitus]|uniref:WD40 repeat-like protein n=1 Tax=Dacryopinax primogenitus (strain DJM 731) TaxID=1858805 RepID=M5G7N8_DACPD|nr:WD40 repeat-like protein [Dacryopinax primogenitus]EJU04759.1 WD40 repeat-like protein [Dacryopinax primogenitus]
MADTMDLDELVNDPSYVLGASERAKAENKAILDELERKKRARTLAVPTDDGRVRARLRELGEPITLFGERAADRRDRLKYILSQLGVERGIPVEDEESSEEEQEEEFYTPGPLELLDARRKLAQFSLPRAMDRVNYQRAESSLPLSRIVDKRKKVFAEVKTFNILGTQVADDRPISQVRFSPDSKLLATGSWSGSVKVWGIPNCDSKLTFRAHSDKVGGVAWHPRATIGQEAAAVNLVSGGGEGDLHLWSLANEQSLATLKGHQDRVCRVAFHPCGDYVGSASYDGTWRLWDVSTAKEILVQEGHSKEVYTLEFQDDGSLAASGGLDAIARVWDLRTGRTAMVLDGHVQGIYGIDFSPNGYQLATASGDDTIRIWDVRALRALHTIPAHKSTVADVRFFKAPVRFEPLAEGLTEPLPSGLYLASAGYDGFVKIWTADDWQLLRSLPTDAGKVMSCDFTKDGKFLASGSWNRSFQLFATEKALDEM